MKVDSNTVDDSVILTIILSKPEVEKEFDAIAASLKPSLELKGFRKGTAPLNVIKAHYNKDIRIKASSKLLNEAATKAIYEAKINAGSNPELLEPFRSTEKKQHLGKFLLDGSFEFAISVKLPPKIDPVNYIGIEIMADHKDFDSWVAKRLREQQMLHGSRDLVDRPAELGDEVMLDFLGSVDGEPLVGGAEEGYKFEIGSNTLQEEFEQALIGHCAGESFTVPVKFPDEFSDEQFKGKLVDFACKLHSVCKVAPHVLDDSFAALFGFADVQELTENYRITWQQEFEKPLRAQKLNLISTKLLEANPFTAPPDWIENESKILVQRFGQSNIGSNPALMAEVKKIAERQVKTAYILDKIYEKEPSIKITADDITKATEKEAAASGVSGLKLIAEMKQRGVYEGFISQIEQNKAVDFLIKNAVVKEI